MQSESDCTVDILHDGIQPLERRAIRWGLRVSLHDCIEVDQPGDLPLIVDRLRVHGDATQIDRFMCAQGNCIAGVLK